MVRYAARPTEEQPLAQELVQLKGQYPRFGIRRAHALLRGSGQIINHKRVQRLWHKYGLQVWQHAKKRKVRTGRTVACLAERPNQVWCYDFQEDALLSGRKVRLLNILDEFTREWLSVTVGVSFTSQTVIAALRPLFARRGIPSFVRSDNGPEFIAADVKAWLQENGAAPHYIDPGCPWQNGFAESFHGKLRDELLDREVFASVAEAVVRLETHRLWYNEERPHSSLNYLSPDQFARAWQQRQEPKKPAD